ILAVCYVIIWWADPCLPPAWRWLPPCLVVVPHWRLGWYIGCLWEGSPLCHNLAVIAAGLATVLSPSPA
ncbi:hypothetical protein NDU88_004383, partial [Pleurodeles waltl]